MQELCICRSDCHRPRCPLSAHVPWQGLHKLPHVLQHFQPFFVCSHCQCGQHAGMQWWHTSRALHGSGPEAQAFKQAAAASLERERIILECLSHSLLSKGPADARSGAGLGCVHAPLTCARASSTCRGACSRCPCCWELPESSAPAHSCTTCECCVQCSRHARSRGWAGRHHRYIRMPS